MAKVVEDRSRYPKVKLRCGACVMTFVDTPSGKFDALKALEDHARRIEEVGRKCPSSLETLTDYLRQSL